MGSERDDERRQADRQRGRQAGKQFEGLNKVERCMCSKLTLLGPTPMAGGLSLSSYSVIPHG